MTAVTSPTPADGHTVPADTDSIFGRSVSGWDVEQWAFDLMKRWASSYMAEVERRHGLEVCSLARPRAYVPTIAFDAWPEDQLPRVMLIATGTNGTPVRHGDGTYLARFSIDVAVLCSARTQAESHRNAQLTTEALRDLFIQRPSLDGHADGVTWTAEGYAPIAYDDSRSLSGGLASFLVDVDRVAAARAGPLRPDRPSDCDPDPWPPWQRVRSVWVRVENYPADRPLPSGPVDARRLFDDDQALATHDQEERDETRS